MCSRRKTLYVITYVVSTRYYNEGGRVLLRYRASRNYQVPKSLGKCFFIEGPQGHRIRVLSVYERSPRGSWPSQGVPRETVPNRSRARDTAPPAWPAVSADCVSYRGVA